MDDFAITNPNELFLFVIFYKWQITRRLILHMRLYSKEKRESRFDMPVWLVNQSFISKFLQIWWMGLFWKTFDFVDDNYATSNILCTFAVVLNFSYGSRTVILAVFRCGLWSLLGSLAVYVENCHWYAPMSLFKFCLVTSADKGNVFFRLQWVAVQMLYCRRFWLK